MSWDGYRDSLVGSGNLKQVAIIGAGDGAVWTCTSGFTISPTESTSLINGFANADCLKSSGITVGGEKYFYLLSDDSQIQGKKGAGGVSIAKSKMCIIIGTYAEGQQPGNARNVVESMCEYLRSNNY